MIVIVSENKVHITYLFEWSLLKASLSSIDLIIILLLNKFWNDKSCVSASCQHIWASNQSFCIMPLPHDLWCRLFGSSKWYSLAGRDLFQPVAIDHLLSVIGLPLEKPYVMALILFRL